VKNVVWRGLVATVLLCGLLAPAADAAQKPKPTKPGVDRQIQTLRSQLDEVSAEEAELLDQLDGSRARLRDLDAKVAAVEARMAPVQKALDEAQARLDDLEAREQGAQVKLDAARADLAAARDALARQAIAAYTGQNLASRYADLALHVRTMRELAASTGYVHAVLREQTNAIHRFRDLRDQVTKLRDSLEEARGQALDQRNVVADEERQLEEQHRAADDVRDQAASEVGRQNALLGQMRARKAEFEAQLAALKRQSDQLASLLRGRQAGQVLVPSGHGVLSVPIPGAPITSGFGPRVHPIFGDVRTHTGIDFGASSGTPIRAAADGVVVSAGSLGGYGNATVVDHGNSLATLYGHQSQIVVSPGQRVSRGQVIGYVGCSGYCTGPHLHFEVRVQGTPVDPMQYL
jgi:murein DD-endopeptidase MepM/ murein hydrolase activator NlpD